MSCFKGISGAFSNLWNKVSKKDADSTNRKPCEDDYNKPRPALSSHASYRQSDLWPASVEAQERATYSRESRGFSRPISSFREESNQSRVSSVPSSQPMSGSMYPSYDTNTRTSFALPSNKESPLSKRSSIAPAPASTPQRAYSTNCGLTSAISYPKENVEFKAASTALASKLTQQPASAAYLEHKQALNKAQERVTYPLEPREFSRSLSLHREDSIQSRESSVPSSQSKSGSMYPSYDTNTQVSRVLPSNKGVSSVPTSQSKSGSMYPSYDTDTQVSRVLPSNKGVSSVPTSQSKSGSMYPSYDINTRTSLVLPSNKESTLPRRSSTAPAPASTPQRAYSTNCGCTPVVTSPKAIAQSKAAYTAVASKLTSQPATAAYLEYKQRPLGVSSRGEHSQQELFSAPTQQVEPQMSFSAHTEEVENEYHRNDEEDDYYHYSDEEHEYEEKDDDYHYSEEEELVYEGEEEDVDEEKDEDEDEEKDEYDEEERRHEESSVTRSAMVQRAYVENKQQTQLGPSLSTTERSVTRRNLVLTDRDVHSPIQATRRRSTTELLPERNRIPKTQFQALNKHINSYYVQNLGSLNTDYEDDYEGQQSSYRKTCLPYRPDQVNTWFREVVHRDPAAEPAGKPHIAYIDMINLMRTDDFGTMLTAVAKFRTIRLEDGEELYFHATDAQSARSILEKGIDLTKTREREDFSNGYGFYITTDYRRSTSWATRKASKYCHSTGAIIAFKVSRQLQQEQVHLYLEVNTAEGRRNWEKTVSHFRNGEAIGALSVLLGNVKFIRGPVSKNAFLRPGEVPVEHDFTQVCLHDEEYAERYGSLRNICFVIFFKVD